MSNAEVEYRVYLDRTTILRQNKNMFCDSANGEATAN